MEKLPRESRNGGVIQRRSREPERSTTYCRQRVERTRCTVRWLVPSAKGQGRARHDSPSARKASTPACFSSTGRASSRRQAVRGAAPAQTPASSRLRPPPSEAPYEAALRPATARDDLPGELDRKGRASSVRLPATPPSARASANNTGRRPARPRGVFDARHDGKRPRRVLSTPAALRPHRAGGSSPRHCASRRAGCSGRGVSFRPPPPARDTPRGAVFSGPGGCSRAPPSSGGVASRSPQLTRLWATLDAGGGAGSSSASVRLASSRRSISEALTSRYRARSIDPVTVRFERRTRRADTPQPNSRETAIWPRRRRTAHATALRTEGARISGREGLRSNEIAELRHRDAAPQREPVRRRAEQPASMPRGSPAASARLEAAVIKESIATLWRRGARHGCLPVRACGSSRPSCPALKIHHPYAGSRRLRWHGMINRDRLLGYGLADVSGEPAVRRRVPCQPARAW